MRLADTLEHSQPVEISPTVGIVRRADNVLQAMTLLEGFVESIRTTFNQPTPVVVKPAPVTTPAATVAVMATTEKINASNQTARAELERLRQANASIKEEIEAKNKKEAQAAGSGTQAGGNTWLWGLLLAAALGGVYYFKSNKAKK